jgi:hypothetical protein
VIPLEVAIGRPGSTPLRLTPLQRSLRWTTAAIGGFGACSFELPGDAGRWKREIPHLATVRIVLDTFVIWEGQVEDVTLRPADGGVSVSCFGFRRKLEEVSVRRIWSKRDLPWAEAPGGLGANMPFTGIGNLAKADLSVSIGQVDISDLTKIGVRVAGNGVVVATSAGGAALALIGPNISVQTILFDLTIGPANLAAARVWTWNSYSSGSLASTDFTTSGAKSVSGASRDSIGFCGWNNSGVNKTPIASEFCDFLNIRILGTSLGEDVAGGFYGGSILRDLIALVPGLTLGIIEDGSDFTIQTIERAVRSSSMSVVEEVAGFYAREWSIWEDGRFDWKTANRDEPQWLTRVADLQSGTEITSSVDGLAKTVYVLYMDAAEQRDKEASSTSTTQANPYVKQGKSQDVLVAPGFPMTSSTSAQLSSRLVTDQGSYPAIRGRLVLPAMLPVKRANGPSLPAFQIRSGENVLVSDLPKTDLFQSGRDGETLFHIIGTEAELETGRVVLEIEGQTRRSDILLARLAAATRGVTG